MPKLLAASTLLLSAAVAQDFGVSFTNGVDGYLETPYAPQLVPATGITVEAWLTYDDNIGAGVFRYPTVLRQNVAAGAESYFLRVNAGNTASRVLRWKVVTTAGTQLSADWTFPAGQFNTWTHVAGTYDGALCALYVNGNLVASANGNNQPLRDLGGTLRIGKGDDATGANEVWNGGLDEVRIWPVARTAAEIQASMQQKLVGVPGRAVTWNLDNFLLDTSSLLTLTATGNAPFTPNPLVLAVPSMPTAVGASSPGCLGDLLLLPTGAAQLGNLAFAAACTRVPTGSIAIWAASLNTLPAPLPVLGVDVWLDPASLVTVTALAQPLGSLRLPFPIPATAPLGFAFALQAFVVDPCGPQDFTSSDALAIVVQP